MRDRLRADRYAQLARIGKVVVHPKRIELLELLCQAERRVEALPEWRQAGLPVEEDIATDGGSSSSPAVTGPL